MNTRARNNVGKALVELHDLDGAMKEFQEVVRTKPGDLEASINIGMVLGYQGRLGDAIMRLRAVSERYPQSADAQFRLAVALGDSGHFDEAVTHYRKALALDPLARPALNNLAWLRATCPKASLRNGAEAVALAEEAVELSDGADPEVLDTLAAAYAEACRFSEAAATGRKALELAWRKRKISLINDLQAQLALYESGKPYHRPP
jgi:Flp pilus assembly protein TadD